MKRYAGPLLAIHSVLTRQKHIEGVPVEPLALHPETGGPKNLPIVKSYLADTEDEEASALKGKPHLVIVGGGWGVSTLGYGVYRI